MKLFSLFIPSLFFVASAHAQDSLTSAQPTHKEVRRDLFSKIESAVANYDYTQIEEWSKSRSITASLTQQDLKPLLDTCTSRVKWTDYVKKYYHPALQPLGNVLTIFGAPLLIAGFLLFITPGVLLPISIALPARSPVGHLQIFRAGAEDFITSTVVNPLNLLTLPISGPLIVVGGGLSIAGYAIKKVSPANNEALFTYIAMKKLYNSVPTGISRHHKTHKHAHRKR